jgi:site-specific DNA-methyltransferase (adenine-specific)
MFSFVGDTILDPFGGTGTTALAAMELNRASVTYEVEPQYLPLIVKRLQKPTLTTGEVVFERRVDDSARYAPSPSRAHASS